MPIDFYRAASAKGKPVPPRPVLVALGGLILMGYALWRLCRHPVYRWAGLTGVAFWVLLAPTSSFIPSYDFAFEHRLYMPMLGFAPFVPRLLDHGG